MVETCCKHAFRYTLKLGCPMDLRNYPLDRQSCNVEMEMYTHSTNEVRLKWRDYLPIEFAGYIPLKTFSLVGSYADDCTNVYSIGNYDHYF